MTYRVLYKKFSEMNKGFLLIEETIDAASFSIIDGALVFHREFPVLRSDYPDLRPVWAVPPTFWVSVEPAESSAPPPSLVTP